MDFLAKSENPRLMWTKGVITDFQPCCFSRVSLFFNFVACFLKRSWPTDKRSCSTTRREETQSTQRVQCCKARSRGELQLSQRFVVSSRPHVLRRKKTLESSGLGQVFCSKHVSRERRKVMYRVLDTVFTLCFSPENGSVRNCWLTLIVKQRVLRV